MLEYEVNIDALFRQCDELYKTYPVNVERQIEQLDAKASEQPEAGVFTRKSWIYETGARKCDIHIFPESPFFAEVITGRERNSVTSGFPPNPGIASWLMNSQPDFLEEFNEWRRPYNEKDLMSGTMFTDCAHHYADVETILTSGYLGIRKQAEAAKPVTARETDFIRSVITACDCMCEIAGNFARKAEELLKTETDPRYRRNYRLIADTAGRVPANPPETFYEALCTIWFAREMCNTFEGFGFAVLGHLDRLLYPYYERDIREGRLSREAAGQLILCFLALTDARWDLTDIPGGTNATVMIGGSEPDGALIYNEVTKLFIEAFLRADLANPKLQARVTCGHPAEYFELLGRLAGKGSNVLSIFNDPVIIKSHTLAHKKEEDCYHYLAGGCQEITLQNEVNCRAYAYVNLPQMLLLQFHPEQWGFMKKDNIFLTPVLSSFDFEEFYRRFLFNYTALFQGISMGYNRFEGRWRDYNPCPLFSLMMDPCVERMLDVSEGGAFYNTNSLAMAGFGTLVDSLYTLKVMVFEQKRISLPEFVRILDQNFEGEEQLRQYILNKIPKYGSDSEEVRAFAAKIAKDIAGCIHPLANGHGGYYEASLFAFYSYSWLKEHTGATPDGRLAGKELSRGVNPSESTAGIDAAALAFAQNSMDYTRYPGGAVVYMDLPITKNHIQNNVYADIILYFIQNGGCIMDFNVINREQLIEAQKDPENHKNIIVRVCGYSAPFYSLSKDMQDEIINRTQR